MPNNTLVQCCNQDENTCPVEFLANKIKKVAAMDQDEPDRSMGDFYCKWCDSHMNSFGTWESHVTGKRHIKNKRKPQGDPAAKLRTNAANIQPFIQSELDEVEEPLVGLQYMCEIQKTETKPSYNCFLCNSNMVGSVVIEHLLSTKHKLAFLKNDYTGQYQSIIEMNLTKQAEDSLIDGSVATIEQEHGRGTMQVKKEKPAVNIGALYQLQQAGSGSQTAEFFSTHFKPLRDQSPESSDTASYNRDDTPEPEAPIDLRELKNFPECLTSEAKIALVKKLIDTLPSSRKIATALQKLSFGISDGLYIHDLRKMSEDELREHADKLNGKRKIFHPKGAIPIFLKDYSATNAE